MNVFQIAMRSVRQRGLASILTMASMALAVMLVVAVLSIHGVVTKQFRANAGLGYNLIVGANKGGRLQLTLNSVFYLSQPVENIDYSYYLEFLSPEERLKAWGRSLRAKAVLPEGEPMTEAVMEQIGLKAEGAHADSVAFAIPICLGDYYAYYRVVGTTPAFFENLIVPDSGGSGLRFAEGESFAEWSEEHGYFEAVVGATVAREKKLKVGDRISPVHGDPEGDEHEKNFYVSGVLAPSGTPNDRAVFVNMDGFLLLDGHEKPLPSVSVSSPTISEGEANFVFFDVMLSESTTSDISLSISVNGHRGAAFGDTEIFNGIEWTKSDKLAINAGDELARVRVAVGDDERVESTHAFTLHVEALTENIDNKTAAGVCTVVDDDGGAEIFGDEPLEAPLEALPAAEEEDEPLESTGNSGGEVGDVDADPDAHFRIKESLDLEKREVTAILVRSYDPFTGQSLMYDINNGKDAQCAQPIRQIQILLDQMVRPIQWVLLILTGIICLVASISILVSIYNSMSERRHEIAVIRALGATRSTVTTIVLLEAIILAVGGGLIGWVMGHGLNVAASGIVEERTGVQLGFWDFAPPIDLGAMLGADQDLWLFRWSPELLLVPLLMVLAVIVGLAPAWSAYHTSVSKWLGK